MVMSIVQDVEEYSLQDKETGKLEIEMKRPKKPWQLKLFDMKFDSFFYRRNGQCSFAGNFKMNKDNRIFHTIIRNGKTPCGNKTRYIDVMILNFPELPTWRTISSYVPKKRMSKKKEEVFVKGIVSEAYLDVINYNANVGRRYDGSDMSEEEKDKVRKWNTEHQEFYTKYPELICN